MNETMDDPKSMISGVQVAAAPLILVVVLIIHIFSGHIQQYLGKLQVPISPPPSPTTKEK
jgi:hypothetical protein